MIPHKKSFFQALSPPPPPLATNILENQNVYRILEKTQIMIMYSRYLKIKILLKGALFVFDFFLYILPFYCVLETNFVDYCIQVKKDSG